MPRKTIHKAECEVYSKDCVKVESVDFSYRKEIDIKVCESGRYDSYMQVSLSHEKARDLAKAILKEVGDE